MAKYTHIKLDMEAPESTHLLSLFCSLSSFSLVNLKTGLLVEAMPKG